MTILNALRRINAYPIPLGELDTIALSRGLDTDGEADRETLHSTGYRLATADVLIWLSEAPNVSQDGISYSFTDEQRKRFKARALAIMEACGEADEAKLGGVNFGYKGELL